MVSSSGFYFGRRCLLLHNRAFQLKLPGHKFILNFRITACIKGDFLMRVSVESYAYVLVKLARLRKHRITPREIPRLEEVSTLADFMEIFSRYYPDVPLTLPELTLVNFENIIWKDYFDAATRIINACPQTWQQVLTEYLLKYQIKNVKTIILGKIA